MRLGNLVRTMSKKSFDHAFVALTLFGIGLLTPAAAEKANNYAFCTRWSYDRNDKFYASTHCEFATEIQFLSRWNEYPIIRIIGPGTKSGTFETFLTKKQIVSRSGWWMATTCPISVVTGRALKPDIPFWPRNRDRIQAGDYKCVDE